MAIMKRQEKLCFLCIKIMARKKWDVYYNDKYVFLKVDQLWFNENVRFIFTKYALFW